MKIFLSVAGSERDRVEETAYALKAEGFDVFLDDHTLPAGETYHRRIRDELFSSDLAVFFVSPTALEAGRYTLTEIELAKELWGQAHGRVLPVELVPVDMRRVPPFLRSVSFCKPKGNMAAEVANVVHKLASNVERGGPRAGSSGGASRSGTGGGAGTNGVTESSSVSGLIAALAFMVLAAVVSVLTHQLINGFEEHFGHSIALKLGLHGLTLTLLVWLAALLFNLRGAAPFLALATGSFGAYMFELAASDVPERLDWLVSVCKSLVFVAIASLGVVSFRTWRSWISFGIAGALAFYLWGLFTGTVPGTQALLWRSLMVGVAAYFIEIGRYERARGLTLLMSARSWFGGELRGGERRRRA